MSLPALPAVRGARGDQDDSDWAASVGLANAGPPLGLDGGGGAAVRASAAPVPRSASGRHQPALQASPFAEPALPTGGRGGGSGPGSGQASPPVMAAAVAASPEVTARVSAATAAAVAAAAAEQASRAAAMGSSYQSQRGAPAAAQTPPPVQQQPQAQPQLQQQQPPPQQAQPAAQQQQQQQHHHHMLQSGADHSQRAVVDQPPGFIPDSGEVAVPAASYVATTSAYGQQARPSPGAVLPAEQVGPGRPVAAAQQLGMASAAAATGVVVGSRDGNGRILGRWESSLFDCFDNVVPSCLTATFLPCVIFGQLAARTRYGGCPCHTAVVTAFVVVALVLLVVSPLLAALAWGIVAGMLALLRRHIRQQFSIPSAAGAFEDLWYSCCCPWCALAQQARHVFDYSDGGECTLTSPAALPPV